MTDLYERLSEVEQELERLEGESRDNEVVNSLIYDAQNAVASALAELDDDA